MRWVKVLVILSVVALLVLLAYGFWTNPRLIPSPLVGGPAPDFTLTILDGDELRLRDLRGRSVVVNFWASWCYPACWNEAPRLEATWQRYKDQGVMLIGIVYQDTENNARDFIEKHGKTYPNGLDVKSRIAIEYGVFGLPETFFIDPEGKIAHKHIGEISMETLIAETEALLPVARSGIGVLAVAVGSGLFSRAAHDRGYQQVVQWSRPDGEGLFVATGPDPSMDELRALGERLRAEFREQEDLVIMIFDDVGAAREVFRGSRLIGEEPFRAALAHQRAIYLKNVKRSEHKLTIYSPYPVVHEVIRY
jgi:cytochrome c biogenesis protein CcmG/thiol:disulfide interchange protein DsbE